MTIIHRAGLPVNPGCAHRPSLGYEFDPVPRQAIDLVAARELQPIDLELLAVLLRYRTRLRASCWTTIGRLAEGIGRSESTVQRSLRRLRAAGLVRHVQVAERGEADPDEPRNRTGWRFFFAWMESAPSAASVTPTPRHECHPPPVIGDTQEETERTPPQRANQDDDAPVVVVPSPPPEEKTKAPALERAIEAAGSLVERPAGAVGRIMREMPGTSPAAIVEACELARAKGRGWSYAIGVLSNWSTEGRALPPAPKPRVERSYYRAPVPTEADRAAARESGRLLRDLLAGAT